MCTRSAAARRLVLSLALLATAVSTPAVAQRGGGATPVHTATVATAPISDPIEALGTARANETVQLTASVAEKVTAINFDDGEQVQAGATLVVFDMAEERAELKAAEAELAKSQLAYDRAIELERRKVASAATVDERRAQLRSAEADILAIKARITDRTLTAPFDGQVGLRHVSVGALVRPGDVITSLDDLSLIKVDFAVPALKLGLLRTGLPITAKTAAFPDRLYQGTVRSINPQVDPITRSVMVRAVIDNEDLSLVPGLLIEVTIEAKPRSALVIPEGAIVPMAKQAFVYIAQADGTAKKVEVQTGTRRDGMIEILSGLNQGDTIVTDGNHRIRDGSAIKVEAPLSSMDR